MIFEFTLQNIQQAAAQFWSLAGDAKIFAFHAPMGTGKTTFIQQLCIAKGVQSVVSSPTFSIINEYVYDCNGTKRAIFHMDLYRLRDEAEAIQAGVEDTLYSGYICLVEWPEKAPALFPPGTVHVHLERINADTCRCSITQN
ncbi:tRNA (adenosine(37)-N6)-threonylcarbamoyltransferase complex ATPase subunit type 1 TsaE [Terrimonas rubra]|uniref:tRNA threonylcarbamoyladenosine biosynthesis protein TsaE n=1 Tax=Terrimonas rubra TaxID=1035890 RepID=A0ABW6A2Q8_9BACT